MSEHTGGWSIRTKGFLSIPSWLTIQRIHPLSKALIIPRLYWTLLNICLPLGGSGKTWIHLVFIPLLLPGTSAFPTSSFIFLIITCNIFGFFFLWLPLPNIELNLPGWISLCKDWEWHNPLITNTEGSIFANRDGIIRTLLLY